MYECSYCGKVYKNEQEAIDCCSKDIRYEDGDFKLSPKCGMRPISKTHHCPNMDLDGKSWSTMLKVDEKCPMCNYVYRPR